MGMDANMLACIIRALAENRIQDAKKESNLLLFK